MFACIYGEAFPKIDQPDPQAAALVNLGFSFSPLVEKTSANTVVFNVEGEKILFAPAIASPNVGRTWLYNLAEQIRRCAHQAGLKVNVAIAANPDAAIHAARAVDGLTVIGEGDERRRLGSFSLKLLDYSLAGIDGLRAAEIRETFTLWGLRAFGDFAELPVAGVAQRLGPEGVRLQKLAAGTSERHLVMVQPSIGFEQSLELEHAIAELDPLSFILSRLLNQLCLNLDAHAFATNELRLRLDLENKTTHDRTLCLPVPMCNAKTFLRLCLLDLESHPPPAPVIGVWIAAEPTRPRVLQNGLFVPLAPEPEKLELTLARLTKLVGAENVGSPEILDTHRADAFRMKRFAIIAGGKRRNSNRQSPVNSRQCIVGFRRFRPPLPSQVITNGDSPTRISTRKPASAEIVRGKIVKACGPWRTSGDWWRTDVWARDEWDVAVADTNSQSEILCRLVRDLITEDWFVEGIYD